MAEKSNRIEIHHFLIIIFLRRFLTLASKIGIMILVLVFFNFQKVARQIKAENLFSFENSLLLLFLNSTNFLSKRLLERD